MITIVQEDIFRWKNFIRIKSKERSKIIIIILRVEPSVIVKSIFVFFWNWTFWKRKKLKLKIKFSEVRILKFIKKIVFRLKPHFFGKIFNFFFQFQIKILTIISAWDLTSISGQIASNNLFFSFHFAVNWHRFQNKIWQHPKITLNPLHSLILTAACSVTRNPIVNQK